MKERYKMPSRKQKIPSAVRAKVWDTYVGISTGRDKCFCGIKSCNYIPVNRDIIYGCREPTHVPQKIDFSARWFVKINNL